MRKLTAVSTIAMLAFVSGATAEDNNDLLHPSYVGEVTGNPEKDTFGYDVNVPSDLWIRSSTACLGRSACADTTAEAESNSVPAVYLGEVTGDPEKDTFGQNLRAAADSTIDITAR